jgi:uncharacterized protein (TIGR02588 family)
MRKIRGAEGAGDDKKNFLEWTVFTVSLLLVLSTVVYLIYQLYTEKEETPDIQTEYWADPSEHNPYRYRVVLYNRGGQTAESVTVELTVKQGNKNIEKAELQISFVPKESKREGWVNFSKDPTKADTLEARVLSYKKP